MNFMEEAKNRNRLTIFLGIGDILLTLLTLIHSDNLDKFKLELPNEIVTAYRNQPNSYKKLVEDLLNQVKVPWEWIMDGANRATPTVVLFHRYQLTDISQARAKLISLFGIDQRTLPVNLPSKYVVIHTKSRDYNNLQSIREFCQTYKSDVPIVIVGERIISQNKENQICGAHSAYEIFMKELSINNTVIDRTHLGIQEISDFQVLCTDLSVIYHAECNIICGQGGNLIMSAIFSKSFVCCLGDINPHPLFSSCPHGVFCREAHLMTEAIVSVTITDH